MKDKSAVQNIDLALRDELWIRYDRREKALPQFDCEPVLPQSILYFGWVACTRNISAAFFEIIAMSKNLIALQNKFLGHGNTVYDVLSRLHRDQGFISDQDIDRLANEHNLPRAHLRATTKFYEELAQDKPASRSLKICNGEACRAAGCDSLISGIKERLRVGEDHHSPEGIRVETIACLGYCGKGPNAMIDGHPVSLAEHSAQDQILADLQGGTAHKLKEPDNEWQKPKDGQPCVLMARFGEHAQKLARARELGAYNCLEGALKQLSPEKVLEEVEKSQIRGRGGAGFPTAIKWRTVATSEAPDQSGRRFVVINFDEGDAGSYIDKELIEHDPHGQIEGILLAAYACRAQEAIIYARMEYPRARRILEDAIEEARKNGLVGNNILGSQFSCEIRVVCGQGAYICGEETSLLRSLEGLPALVSIRPPFPAQEGLWRCPTAVNNVETIHSIPWIVANGGAKYAAIGYERSRGTKAISLNHRVRKPGMYEVPFGITLREIIFGLAGGMAKGETFKAVQIGGPLGGILPEHLLDTPLDFEALAAVDGIVGHAGVVVYSQNDDLVAIARGLMHFCAVESCGKCFPCRIGAVRGTELIDQMVDSGVTAARMNLLEELCETMKVGSLCAMGGMTPVPIECLIKYFPEELQRYRKQTV